MRIATLCLSNRLEELHRAQAWLEALLTPASLELECRNQLAVILEEILVNIMVHGDPGGESLQITLRGWIEDAWLELQIEDTALPFNPLEMPEQDIDAPIDNRPIGGLGIHLIKEFADVLRYEPVVGGNRLQIRKRLTLDNPRPVRDRQS